MSRGGGGARQARPVQASAVWRDIKLEIWREEQKYFRPGLPSVRDGLGNRPGLSPNFCKKNDKAIEETENLNS